MNTRPPFPDGGLTAADGATILVADDEPLICDLLEIILEPIGIHVLKATSARAAQHLALTNPEIQLLLTEIDFRDASGEDLADWFHIFRPTVPVVFMSGSFLSSGQCSSGQRLAKPFQGTAVVSRTILRALRLDPGVQPCAA